VTSLGIVFSRQALRRNLLLAVSAIVLLAGVAVAPAQAQARIDRDEWRRSDRAERKARKRAQKDYNRDGVIDRSERQSNRYYRDRNYTGTRNRTQPRVYDYRNSPYDPYYNNPNYRRNPYNPYGNYGGNYGYYGNGYPQTDSRYYDNREGDEDREEVARRAAQQGYYEGYQRGQYDRQSGARQPKPTGHGAYQFGFSGWNPDWGSAQTYQQYYRQYFIQGYNDGFGRRNMNSRYSRRWW
jgi:hypothetical protein